MYEQISDSYNLTKLAVAKAYPNRQELADELTDWNSLYSEYKPTEYTSTIVLNADWADPVEPSLPLIINRLVEDDTVNFNKDQMPLNPNGRSGIRGRGLLGAFGPNYLGICVVLSPDDHQVLTLHHLDTGFTALPAGYRSGNESIVRAATREMNEEIAPKFAPKTIERVGKLFFVPDPKTTDNAWIMAGVAAIKVENKSEVVIENDNIETKDGRWLDVDEAKKVLFPAHAYAVELALKYYGL